MNPEDLEKYDPNHEADDRLRAALKDATDRLVRATDKLINGQIRTNPKAALGLTPLVALPPFVRKPAVAYRP